MLSSVCVWSRVCDVKSVETDRAADEAAGQAARARVWLAGPGLNEIVRPSDCPRCVFGVGEFGRRTDGLSVVVGRMH